MGNNNHLITQSHRPQNYHTPSGHHLTKEEIIRFLPVDLIWSSDDLNVHKVYKWSTGLAPLWLWKLDPWWWWWSTISSRSSSSSWSSLPVPLCVDELNMECEDMAEFLEKLPLRGPIKVRWLAGFTVTIKLLELATIMSVTWGEDIWTASKGCERRIFVRIGAATFVSHLYSTSSTEAHILNCSPGQDSCQPPRSRWPPAPRRSPLAALLTPPDLQGPVCRAISEFLEGILYSVQ